MLFRSISVIPPIVIGFVVGALSAIMGIGGGFIIVPAMIYLLRMPTNVVIGTSLVQIIGVAIVTTLLQATSNYAVDIVLAAILVVGGVVGALSAIMGIGGGFIIVPAMIYILRMPTNVVMGTSLAQIIAVTAITTVLQSTSNYAVDIILAGLLVIGGVVGAQLGVRAGAKLRGEQLRLLLAVIVLTVAAGLAWQLIAPPLDVYSLSEAAP